ncbi:hypothetical protein FO519_002913 [Halicephalobus sp. NKZ332]|nr:hypothetical protein FO519_002913 [Halicephalobus sp. NKZ332]
MVRSIFFLVATVGFLMTFETVCGCFLNSCPYRRYGRNVRCATCGSKGEGVCVAEGVCCTSRACSEHTSCEGVPTCATRTCVAGDSVGFCVSPVLCCSQDFCQQSMSCLLNRAESHFPL